MDGQDRLEGDEDIVAILAGDVPVGGPGATDLFAVLSLAAAVAAGGDVDLREAQGARAAVRAASRQVKKPAMASSSRPNDPKVSTTVRRAVNSSMDLK